MLKAFIREEKKLLKDLKNKYFHFIVMNCMSIKGKKKKKNKIKNHLIHMKLLNG